MAVLSDNWPLDFGILLLAIFGAVYLFFTRHFKTWEKKGVYFLKPLPFVGHFKDLVLSKLNIGQIIWEAYDAGKGKPLIGIFAFDQPMLIVRDPELVKKVLVKDFNYFMDRNVNSDEDSEPFLARGLFSMKGQRWRHLRNNLSPAFTSGKIKRMFQFIDECGKNLVLYMDKHSVDGRLLVKESMARYTTDVIASSVCGIQGHALENPNSEFRQYLRRVVDLSVSKTIKTAIGFFAPSLMKLLKLRIIDEDIGNYIRGIVWNTVEHRKKNGIIRKDLLDILMQLRDNGRIENDEISNGQTTTAGPKFELEGDDFVAQAFGFLVAGFETSSTTMSFALYEMSLQPEIQTRLRNEIQTVLEKFGGQLTYEAVQEMSYLDMVVSETLRKYPVIPFLDRTVQQTYTFPDTNVQLDKGDLVVIPLAGLHYDSQFYPNPHHFDPERFTEENKRSRPSYTYMPFGEGPRNCIGMRLGLLQTKVGLVHLLSQFEVAPCGDTPIPIKLNPKTFLFTPEGDLPLSIQHVK